MAIETTTITLPAYWSSALINNDWSGLNDREAELLKAWQALNPEYEIVDTARDDEGDAIEPRFTWPYRLYGGDCDGGEVLDYVAHIRS